MSIATASPHEPTAVLYITLPRSAKEQLRQVSATQDRPMSAIVGEFLEPAIASGWETGAKPRRSLSAVMASAHVAWAKKHRPWLLQPWLNR